MGVGLGWQRMHSSNPYISGQAWSDKVTRIGNNVSYSLNLCMKVEKASGYWDYVWYVDMQVGSNISNSRKVKNNTSWHQIIGGREYYQSTFNGNFIGSINVSGKATSIQLRAQFHDSIGNRGPNVYWDVPIPAATSMDDIKATVSDIDTTSAKISGAITKAGDYSTITSWKLEYGITNYNENTKTISENNLSANWILENLVPDKDYKYRITVTSSSGYSKQITGVFRTEEEVIGYKVVKGELVEPGVYEDGEVSGESVQINNIYESEGQITSVEMLGNATQAGTPTPTSPQPISVVTGENVVKVEGKNLLNSSTIEQGTIRGATGQDDNDDYRVRTSGYIQAQSQTTYTVNAKAVDTSKGTQAIIFCYDANENYLGRTAEGFRTCPCSGTTLENTSKIRIVFSLSPSARFTPSDITDVQLELGSTATAYEPYHGQEFEVNLGSIELAKIGDYQDRIFKTDGKWYIEKKVGKVVLDGTETWNASGDQYYTGILQSVVAPTPNTSTLLGYSQFFLVQGYNYQSDTNLVFHPNKNLQVKNTNYPTKTDWTTWLASHPTTVYYALATPTTTEITNEALIAQLDALGASSLYVGLNNILVATSNAVPTLKINYKLTVKEPVYDDRSDELVGWIIYPDGRKKKIKEIRRVYPT